MGTTGWPVGHLGKLDSTAVPEQNQPLPWIFSYRSETWLNCLLHITTEGREASQQPLQTSPRGINEPQKFVFLTFSHQNDEFGENVSNKSCSACNFG